MTGKRGKGRPRASAQERRELALTAQRLVREEQAAAPELLLKVIHARVAKRLGIGTRALQLRLAEAPAAAAGERDLEHQLAVFKRQQENMEAIAKAARAKTREWIARLGRN